MGGEAWGGHTCPGPGPRAAQRQVILDLANKIRAGSGPVAPEPTWKGEVLARAEAVEASVADLRTQLRTHL
jgi:hypothetical protein